MSILIKWEAVLKVDLTGTFLVTKAAIPHLIASGHGVIIIMSSAAGRFGYPNRSPYSTVKWGLIGFMKTLSMELGIHNIRANAILTGSRRWRADPESLPGAGEGHGQIPRRDQGRGHVESIAPSIWWTQRISPHWPSSLRPTPPSRFPARPCRSTATCNETEPGAAHLAGATHERPAFEPVAHSCA